MPNTQRGLIPCCSTACVCQELSRLILHSCRGQGQASNSWWTRTTSLHPHNIISWAMFKTCLWKKTSAGQLFQLLNIRRHPILFGTITFPFHHLQKREVSACGFVHTRVSFLSSSLSNKPHLFYYYFIALVFSGARYQIQDFIYARQPSTTEAHGPVSNPAAIKDSLPSNSPWEISLYS